MIKSFGKPEFVITIFLILIVAMCYYSFFIDLYPQKSNTDLWTHLAIINELKSDNIDEINSPFFSEGERDPRSGVYLSMIAFISKTTHVSTINTYLFAGLLNVVFFILAAYYFGNHFFRQSKVAFLFPFLLVFVWGASVNIGAGMFSLNEMLWTGPFLHFFLIALIFFELVLVDRFLTKKGKSIAEYILILVVGLIIFNSHMLSGAWLFVSMFSLTVGVWAQKRTNYKKVFSLIAAPIIIVILNFLWPLYDQYLFLINHNKASPVLGTSTQTSFILDRISNFIQKWYSVIGIGIIGILFLAKNKLYRIFFSILFVAVGLILVSSLTAYPIKFNWRFITLIMIAVSAGWVALLSSLKRRAGYVVIVCIILIGFFNVDIKMNVFQEWQPYTFQQPYYDNNESSMNILYELNSDSVLFTNPKESSIASGLTGVNVVGVRPRHANFLILADQAKGYNDIVKSFESPKYIQTVIDKYNVSHIMLSNQPDDSETALVAYCKDHFIVAQKNQQYTLYLADADLNQ